MKSYFYLQTGCLLSPPDFVMVGISLKSNFILIKLKKICNNYLLYISRM